ncbi:MAG: YlxR family protein [Eubacteriales bacterium]
MQQPAQAKAYQKPERRCTGCGNRFPKNTLIRVVRSPEGSVSLDGTGKKSGRGAYLCRNPKCLQKAKKGNRLQAALDCVVSEEIYATLEAQLAEYVHESDRK